MSAASCAGVARLSCAFPRSLLFPSALWTPFRSIVRFYSDLTLGCFTAVLTNVPGPQGTVHLAGTDIVQWVSASPG